MIEIREIILYFSYFDHKVSYVGTHNFHSIVALIDGKTIFIQNVFIVSYSKLKIFYFCIQFAIRLHSVSTIILAQNMTRTELNGDIDNDPSM